MDKTAIKNFAIEARKILMKSAITEAGFYGITKDGCQSPVQKGNDFEVYETVAGTENRIFGDDIKRRANLVTAIKEQGFDQVIEETAYTWFNRIIAIRFMEVNNYLPTRVRVLSSETGSATPDIVTQSDTVELNLSSEELERIQTAKRENRYDDAFRSLFIKQCNELNAILPGLFEKTDDYMELLFKITYTGDGVIRMLVDSIPEDNFNVETEGQVEIIGWMYQYYNTELKDDTFAKLKKNVKITKERIPAATQLFTPDWIVRYMVENSLGRVWIEHLRAVDPSVDEKAKAEEFGWEYYLPEAEQEDDVQAQLVEIRKSYKDLTPQDITCIDPCMGSGHILVYMFDVLMDIYRSEGFSEREAVFDVLEKNIRGLDIDRRAYQLSYFALMMKARGYNRIFFRGHEDIEGNRVQAVPRVYAIEESNSIERGQLHYYGAGLNEIEKNNALNQMNGFLDTFTDAKEYGSIINVDNYDWDLLRKFVDKIDDGGQMSLLSYEAVQLQKPLKKLIDIGEILAKKYDAVVTNPPYMGSSGMSNNLTNYVKKIYPISKADLFAVFIEKCEYMLKDKSFCAMITQQAWMFLSGFERLREQMGGFKCVSMLHLGAHAFEEIGGEIVQTTTFVRQKMRISNYKGRYIRLVDYASESEKCLKYKEAKEQKFSGISFEKDEDVFKQVPGIPVAYWVDEQSYNAFNKYDSFAMYSTPLAGICTGNNDLYFRTWQEVNANEIGTTFSSRDEVLSQDDFKWFFHYKGGDYRKWYGNGYYVINYTNDSLNSMEKNKGFRHDNRNFYFKQGITWTKMCSGNFSARKMCKCSMFDSTGTSTFPNEDYYNPLLGLLNSKLMMHFVQILNPTFAIYPNNVGNIPVSKDIFNPVVNRIVEDCVGISKDDWDSFETSWDFEVHPLIIAEELIKENKDFIQGYIGDEIPQSEIERCFRVWEGQCQSRFRKMKSNEEELNRIFIEIYGLQNELRPEVEDKDITIRRADLGRDIRSLISYAVGCMFGRYSLDEKGLVFAGGEFDDSRYKIFPADKDAIIPITDEAYFDDDIVGRFELFIKIIFGSESLEANLSYIADALSTKGNSAREKIRNYFLNDFYKDHCNAYSVTGSGKRPIYWLFDSGKQNGFKCLIYLHRYTSNTVGLIRSDYLTKIQSMIENALKNAEYAINTSSSAVDRAQATKKRDKYIRQLAEIRAYYPALSHIALQRIELDLDDGVKTNYAKFQGIEVSVEGEKKQKVDLLAKI